MPRMRRMPMRWDPVTVKIQRVNKVQSRPTGTSRAVAKARLHEEVEDFEAQLHYDSMMRRFRGQLGNMPRTDGYLTYKAPADATKRLQVGDLIVGVPDGAGGFDTRRFKVLENKPSDNNPGLYLAYFARDEEVDNSR